MVYIWNVGWSNILNGWKKEGSFKRQRQLQIVLCVKLQETVFSLPQQLVQPWGEYKHAQWPWFEIRESSSRDKFLTPDLGNLSVLQTSVTHTLGLEHHVFCHFKTFFDHCFPIKYQILEGKICICRVHHIKCWAGWLISRNQDARRNTNSHNLRYADDTTLMAESKEELKSLLMKVQEKNGKAGLKLNILKTKIIPCIPITSWQIEGE